MLRVKPLVKDYLKNLYWTFYGLGIENPKLPESPDSVLFICKGNICRSPFAEHLAVMLGKEAHPHWRRFYSAGLEVTRPSPPPARAVAAAKYFGIDLEGHKSRKLTADMLESFDIILAMEAWQFKSLKEHYRPFESKIFLLPPFEADGTHKLRGSRFFNIADPYGNSEGVFIECFHRIGNCLNGFFSRIKGR